MGYRIPENFCNLQPVQRNAPFYLDLLKVGGGQSRYLFELATEMGNTGVIQAIGDFAKGKFPIDQEFLGLLNLKLDDVLLQGRSLDFRKQPAQAGIILVKLFSQIFGEIPVR